MSPPLAVLHIMAALAALALASGCASSERQAEERRRALQGEAQALANSLERTAVPVAERELRVRLAFGAGADLDLYVTDPGQETVYFANTPTRAGGRLERDARCDAAPPRVETVTFRNAAPGVYRIGIDFPEHCAGERGPVAFVVRVEREGASEEQRGAIDTLHFLPIVLETEVPPR